MKRYIYRERQFMLPVYIYKYINCDVNEKLTTNAYIRMQIYTANNNNNITNKK